MTTHLKLVKTALEKITQRNITDRRSRQLTVRAAIMERRILRPLDPRCPEFDTEQAGRLRDKWEFANDLEWTIYQAKVFYEVFGVSGLTCPSPTNS